MIKKIIICCAILFAPVFCYSKTLKDISKWRDIRTNTVYGYGIVVGLDGQGDKDKTSATLSDTPITNTKNQASVLVSINLKSGYTTGKEVDVDVSSIGTAKSLKNGYLLPTPLKGLDGVVYAIAKGNIVINDKPLNGSIFNGAIIEKEAPNNLSTSNVRELIMNDNSISANINVFNLIKNKFKEEINIDLINENVFRIKNIGNKESYVLWSEIELLTIENEDNLIIFDKKNGNIGISGNPTLKQGFYLVRDKTVKVETKSGPDKIIEIFKSLRLLGASKDELIDFLKMLELNQSINGSVKII